MSLTASDIEKLSRPFDEHTIGVKIQSLSKNRDKAMLICYLQHTDVYVRLEEVDPAWSCEVASEGSVETTNDKGQITFSTYRVSVRMTVKGVTRQNVGEGDDPKSAYSDAIKRAAMLFGVGRYLYDSEQVWVPYNEQTDKYKKWTYADFAKALRPNQSGPASPGKPSAPAATAKRVTATPSVQAYVFKGGMPKGRVISECQPSEVQGYLNWLKTKCKKPSSAHSEDLAAIELFMGGS